MQDFSTNSNSCVEFRTRPPAWFRYGVVAVAVLILCSCQAATQHTMPSGGNAMYGQSSQVAPQLPEAEFPVAATPVRQIQPVLYQEDLHQPPPAIRRAEYAAGVRPAQCQFLGCPCCEGGEGAVVGPRDEYLCDGGDAGLPAAVKTDWRISGLDQEDTVAHYDTVDGRTIITSSNQVCVYAPRFAAVRRVIDLHEYAHYDAADGFGQVVSLAQSDETQEAVTSSNKLKPNIDRGENPITLLRDRQQLGEMARDERLTEDVGTLAPYADLQIVQTGTLVGDEKVKLARASLAAITWTGDESPQITVDGRNAVAAVSDRQPGVIYRLEEPQKPCLRLLKLASRGSAQPGEEVEFTLRVDNLGNRELRNVTVVDNLTTRLEYVPDSAQASLAAEFSAEPNENGSEVLRWELKESLPKGEGCILQFTCKVR